MRKVIITESQLEYILNEGMSSYPLSMDTASSVRGTTHSEEVCVNNIDPDAKNDVTITDNPSHKRAMSNRLFARSRNVCEDLDDDKVAGFGKKSDAQIQSQAANNGGKMIKNIANRIGNGGQRLNTSDVEIYRMEKDKKENPERYQRNGGDNTLKTLKKTVMQQRQKGKAINSANKNINAITDTADILPQISDNGSTKNHHSENEGNIYYY